ncbi:MAG TPA: tetratricopeptide repeat protein, partial [Steroidobacteraceae bacterium]|nr:tetratricopeptide repeat protein [Steroidobacteraceae bacterium]
MRSSRIIKAALLASWGLCPPAWAQYFTYQGEMQIHPAAENVCSMSSAGTFRVTIVGHDQGPQHGGIEAYLDGDQILHGVIRGSTLSQLSLAYLGESTPSHSMPLRQASGGTYVSELQGNSTLATILGCPLVDAQLKLMRARGKTDRAAFENAASQFELDSRALQATVMGLQGKTKAALPVLHQVLSVKEQSYSPDHAQLLPYYFYIAQVHFEDGTIPMSTRFYRSAASVCDKSYGPDSMCAALALGEVGVSLANDGLYEEAESTLRRALVVCDKAYGPGSPMRGATLNGLAFVLGVTGRYAEAETTLAEALALNKKWPNPDNVFLATTLQWYGTYYQLTGRYKKGIKALAQALQMDGKALGYNNPTTILAAVFLADALRTDGQYEKAEKLARATLTGEESVRGAEHLDHPALSKALVTLAEVLEDTGQYAEAEPLFRRAIANNTRYFGPDHPNVAYDELFFAKLLHATGRDSEALATLSHANSVAHATGQRLITWQVESQLMQIYASGPLANPVQAIFYGKEAVNELQRLRGNLSASGSESLQGFLSMADVAQVYRTLASLLIADGRPAEAEQVVAMLKEQEFYEFVERATPADAPKTVATLNSSEKQLDDLDKTYVSLGNDYSALKKKFEAQGDQFSTADHARLEELRKAMDTAQAAFEKRVSEIAQSANDPDAQRRRRTEINDYSRAFQGTLKSMGHDAVVAQYIVLDDRVAIVLASPNAVVARESRIKRQDLNAQVLAFRKALSDPTEDPRPQAQALYQVLVAPIAEDLRQAGARTLMVDLDDTLRYVPFAALHDGKSYLIESTSVVMVTEAVRDKLGADARSDWKV